MQTALSSSGVGGRSSLCLQGQVLRSEFQAVVVEYSSIALSLLCHLASPFHCSITLLCYLVIIISPYTFTLSLLLLRCSVASSPFFHFVCLALKTTQLAQIFSSPSQQPQPQPWSLSSNRPGSVQHLQLPRLRKPSDRSHLKLARPMSRRRQQTLICKYLSRSSGQGKS
jgi:hypothetical protein